VEISGASHVSILFGRAAMRASQKWSARVLHLPSTAALPSHRPLLGALAGLAGILFIAGPFLREAAGKNRSEEIATTDAVIGIPRLFSGICSGIAADRACPANLDSSEGHRLFQGDYLASFPLLFGLCCW